jgi:hypothetical protein
MSGLGSQSYDKSSTEQSCTPIDDAPSAVTTTRDGLNSVEYVIER